MTSLLNVTVVNFVAAVAHNDAHSDTASAAVVNRKGMFISLLVEVIQNLGSGIALNLAWRKIDANPV
jgi:hypothetical protein